MQNYSNFLIFIFIIVAIMLFASAFLYRKNTKKEYFSRRVMTTYEQKLFIRLKQAFPQYHVLSQVAFSALITSRDYKIRNKFNRKVTDFVLINDLGDVIAIIELDDSSHANKVAEDKFRDFMLNQAGYRVIRLTKIPHLSELKNIL